MIIILIKLYIIIMIIKITILAIILNPQKTNISFSNFHNDN